MNLSFHQFSQLNFDEALSKGLDVVCLQKSRTVETINIKAIKQNYIHGSWRKFSLPIQTNIGFNYVCGGAVSSMQSSFCASIYELSHLFVPLLYRLKARLYHFTEKHLILISDDYDKISKQVMNHQLVTVLIIGTGTCNVIRNETRC